MSTPASDPIEQTLRAQLERNPRSVELHVQLARHLWETHRLNEAAAAMENALALQPQNPGQLYNNLGVIHDHARNWTAASTAFRKAIAIDPDYAVAHLNLGNVLRQMGDIGAAAEYETAVRLNPLNAAAHVGLGLIDYACDRYTSAIQRFHQALRLDPDNASAWVNLTLCHGRMGDHERAIAAAKRAMEVDPTDAAIHSSLIMLLNYTQGANPPVVLEESRRWDRRHARPVGRFVKSHATDRDPARPLRIGYLSPDFRNHALAYFIEPVLSHHDRDRFWIACYAEVESGDDVTERLKSCAAVWRSTVGQSDAQVAEQIRADGVDILVELAGHTVSNRLAVLAHRPAPVQITWLGYPNTTGMSTVDYRLTDRFADPPGSTDPFYSERLILLPDAFFVYRPPPDAPPVAPLPMLANGYVTFGSFHNISKLSAQVVGWWRQLLGGLPSARLLLAGGTEGASAPLRAMFDQTGVGNRVEFVGKVSFKEYLNLHGRVDIALDAFPWNGHTTTCHSLWMGVPVVSLAGPTAVSRAAFSVMSNLGLQAEWVAETPQGYLDLANHRSSHPAELAHLRPTLRDRMKSSPLTDEQRFTKNLEEAYRKIMMSAE